MRHLQVISVVLVVLALAGAAFAQTATLSGTVADQTGAVIQGAEVTVRSLATNATRTSMSGPTGAYAFTNLAPGLFELTAKKQNFKTFAVPDLTLTVAEVATIDIQMQPGGATERVEVRADQLPNVELENAQLSNLVDAKRIQDLPLITRDPYQLVLLSAGTNQSNSRLGGFSVNGSRERDNNFLLDGVDNNDTSVIGSIASANPDSTQEFRVITNNFSPEYGRNNGAIIDVITKSGTNELHGSAYWFGRYNRLGARDWFNHNIDTLTGSVEKQNPYVRNQFGFSVGGPIIKDKTFFFVNNEWARFRTTLTNETTVPTAAFKSGVFTAHNDAGQPFAVDLTSPGSANNTNGLPLDSTTARILAQYPDPNGESVDDVRGKFRFGSSSRFNQWNLTTKIDHNFTGRETLSARYAYNRGDDPNSGNGDFLPGLDAVGLKFTSQNLGLTLTSTLGSNLVNAAKVAWNKNIPFFACGGTGLFDSIGALDPVGRGRDYLMPFGGTFGCGNLGDSNGQGRTTGTYSWADDLNWVRGTHTMKFGAEFRFVYDDGFDSFFSRDQLTFTSFFNFGVPFVDIDPANPCDPNTGDNCGSTVLQDMAGLLFGIVDTDNQAQFFNKAGTRTPNDFRRFRQHEYGFYAQDSWKVRPELTINFGLRYSFNGVPYERDKNFSNLFVDPSGFAPFTFELVGPGTPHLLYDNNYKDFEPRIGFAWDPSKKGKTSIRAGYGVFHDRIFGNLFTNAKGNPPFQQTAFDLPILFDPDPTPGGLPLPLTQTASPTVDDGAGIFPVIFPKHFPTPYTQNWNFGVQHELPWDLTVEVNYVGTHGIRLLRAIDGNPPDPALVQQHIDDGINPARLQFGALYFGSSTLPSFGPSVRNNAFFNAAVNDAGTRSFYHGLQANLRKRFSHGLSAQVAYTYSHAFDDAADPIDAGGGNRSFPRNSHNPDAEYGNSDFDLRHRVVVNYSYELPFGKGKAYLNSGVVGKVLEGWQLSGITSYQTGHAITIFGNRDSEHTSFSSRADLVGSTAQPPNQPRNVTGPNLSGFDFAPFGRGGNLARNQFHGPSYNNWDMVMSKNTSITERIKLEFRFEVYNVVNRPQFDRFDNLIQNIDTFGASTSTITQSDGTTTARQIQTAIRLRF